jgi:DNA-directed RNA polymerase subunit RPC12/RpoP
MRESIVPATPELVIAPKSGCANCGKTLDQLRRKTGAVLVAMSAPSGEWYMCVGCWADGVKRTATTP